MPQPIRPVDKLATRPWIPSLVAIAFGLMTLKEGGSVLFLDGPARAAAGAYVPFVLWFNFMAGFAYVTAGVGFWRRDRWSMWLSSGLFLGTAAVLAAFVVHILVGGAYENRTLVAMTLRTTVWLVLAVWARRSLGASRHEH
ncbi:MAG: hypothetical protein K8J08_08540 [Thermoanaerobaculia bacterium]|nr:hypothetical protein [Thermoanaerobaculia bacterium]